MDNPTFSVKQAFEKGGLRGLLTHDFRKAFHQWIKTPVVNNDWVYLFAQSLAREWKIFASAFWDSQGPNFAANKVLDPDFAIKPGVAAKTTSHFTNDSLFAMWLAFFDHLMLSLVDAINDVVVEEIVNGFSLQGLELISEALRELYGVIGSMHYAHSYMMGLVKDEKLEVVSLDAEQFIDLYLSRIIKDGKLSDDDREIVSQLTGSNGTLTYLSFDRTALVINKTAEEKAKEEAAKKNGTFPFTKITADADDNYNLYFSVSVVIVALSKCIRVTNAIRNMVLSEFDER